MSQAYHALKALYESIKKTPGGMGTLCLENDWVYSTYAEKFNPDLTGNSPSAHEIVTGAIYASGDDFSDVIRQAKQARKDGSCHKTLSRSMIKEASEAISAAVQSDYKNATTVERNDIDRELMEAREAIDQLILSNSKIRNSTQTS